jgi:hypothetical protein
MKSAKKKKIKNTINNIISLDLQFLEMHRSNDQLKVLNTEAIITVILLMKTTLNKKYYYPFSMIYEMACKQFR